MEQSFYKQDSPVVIPAADGKYIAEHFGRASFGGPGLSVARMIAPPGWSEPFQNPEFDEYTLMVRGKKEIHVGEEKVILSAGESLFIPRGSRVRYSNPFSEPAEYWSVCVPAFSPDLAHREK